MAAGNIWLHLAPSLPFWGLLVWWMWHLDHVHASAHLRVVCSVLVCLNLSVAYHTFMAQVHHYYQWLKIDVRSRTFSCSLC